MSQLIEEIIDEIKSELGISRYDIERIVDSEFKCLEDNIRGRTTKTVNMIYLGKFRPTAWFLHNQDKFNKTQEEYEAIKQARREKNRNIQNNKSDK